MAKAPATPREYRVEVTRVPSNGGRPILVRFITPNSTDDVYLTIREAVALRVGLTALMGKHA